MWTHIWWALPRRQPEPIAKASRRSGTGQWCTALAAKHGEVSIRTTDRFERADKLVRRCRLVFDQASKERLLQLAFNELLAAEGEYERAQPFVRARALGLEPGAKVSASD
jgi:hypothetical protein